jgi:uncharacterized protein (TIGR00369 family)
MSEPAHLQRLRERFEGAPVSRYLGHRLAGLGEGRAEVHLPFREEFEQSAGVVHGGLIATVADTAGYFAAASRLEEGEVTTAEFKVNLLAPARRASLVGRAEVLSQGRSLIVCGMTVHTEDGLLVAVGQGTYAVRAPRRE